MKIQSRKRINTISKRSSSKSKFRPNK